MHSEIHTLSPHNINSVGNSFTSNKSPILAFFALHVVHKVKIYHSKVMSCSMHSQTPDMLPGNMLRMRGTKDVHLLHVSFAMKMTRNCHGLKICGMKK
jgi:hypothetical protein